MARHHRFRKGPVGGAGKFSGKSRGNRPEEGPKTNQSKEKEKVTQAKPCHEIKGVVVFSDAERNILSRLLYRGDSNYMQRMGIEKNLFQGDQRAIRQFIGIVSKRLRHPDNYRLTRGEVNTLEDLRRKLLEAKQQVNKSKKPARGLSLSSDEIMTVWQTFWGHAPRNSLEKPLDEMGPEVLKQLFARTGGFLASARHNNPNDPRIEIIESVRKKIAQVLGKTSQ